MLPLSPLLFLVFPAALFVAAQGAGDLQGFTLPAGNAGFDPDPCMVVSPPCMSEADRYSLEALRSIHHMMDDDQDGGIEVEESVEIEIQEHTATPTHFILEMHNWTQDEVLRWLKDFVELPQYERNFKDFKVNGNTLPRIAANEPSFLSGHLRVQDQRDKQKLNIKALDVVLFGPPTRKNNDSPLERAQEEKRNVAEEKQNLEEKMRDEIMGAQEEAYRLHELRQGAVSELSRLRYAEEELVQVRGALKQAEKDMQASWTFSEALQQWLQLTHEVEVQYYNVKKQDAELQLVTAKEEAERIKKKRSSVLGTLHVAHSSSLDQVDHKILQARNSLSEVTACLRERLHRWQQIERICGFRIIRNPGLANLTAQLYSDSIAMGLPRVSQSSCSCHSSVHGSIEDLLDESASPVLPQIPVPAPPLKRSPQTRGSTISRSRRPGVITQPTATVISSDPDLLIPIRAPYPCLDEEEELLLKNLKQQDPLEMYSDADYISSPPLSKMYPSPAVDTSSRKLCHDETELLADSSITKPLSKEKEAVAESPVRKISIEELEASVDISCRMMTKDKVLDTSLEIPSLKMSKEDSLIEATSRKIFRNRGEVPMDIAVRQGLTNESDAEFIGKKVEKDTVGDLMDTASRNIYRERSDLPLDVRMILWDELEASNVAPRKISRDMMGTSMDSASRKIIRDDVERPFDSVSRRITRDSMGMALDTGSRKLSWNKGEYQLDSSVKAMAMDKMVEIARTPSRKISRDELEYCTDTTSIKMLPREQFEAFIDTTSSTEKQDFGVEPSASMRILRDEREMPLGSLRRRPRMLRDNIDSSIDTTMEVPEQSIVREDLGASESGSSPGRIGQPDLTVNSQVPWKSSSDFFAVGPLSQLVYDGILEKSCSSMDTSPTNLLAEVEPPLPPARVAFQSPASHSEIKDEKNKEKEKSKKSLKLKNLFKKKNEPTSEKLQSGLQKL
ncbi:hypothetical protein PAMP_021003 [Pampus punctatissimus]